MDNTGVRIVKQMGETGVEWEAKAGTRCDRGDLYDLMIPDKVVRLGVDIPEGPTVLKDFDMNDGRPSC